MTEEELIIETGTVHVRVKEATTYKKVKNARVMVIQQDTTVFKGTTDYNGEVTFTEVPYGAYTLQITRTGYEPYTNNLNVNHSSLFIPPFLTHSPVDPNQVEVDLDETYTFQITSKLQGNYGILGQILTWITENMEDLVDDYNKAIFGKVNIGFNENILKTFGKKPVCDVYIKGVDYETDFDAHIPVKVNSIVIFYFKGVNNRTYCKACELHDLLVQEFVTNEDWKRCSVVRDTYIKSSNVSIQTIRGGMGVMGAFELSHTLYKNI